MLCPEYWLDAEKALSLGLSLEGLKYSLGYIDRTRLAALMFKDIEKAKLDFETFYIFKNFTSLLEYYRMVSVDLETVYSKRQFSNIHNAVLFSSNESRLIGKYIYGKRMCHVYSLKPATLDWFTNNVLTAKIVDKSMGISEGLNGWVFFTEDILKLQLATTIQTYIEAFTKNNVLIMTERVFALNAESEAKNESVYSCLALCYNQRFKKKFGCKKFNFCNHFESANFLNYCNYYDVSPYFDNLTMSDIWASIDSGQLNALIMEECWTKCPRRGDRTFYSSWLTYSRPLRKSKLQNSNQTNFSFVEISLIHNA